MAYDYSRIRKRVIGREYPLHERVVIFVYLGMIIAGIMFITINFAIGHIYKDNLVWFAFLITNMLAALLYIRFVKQRELIKNISFGIILFVFSPLLFFYSGGLKSAGPIYVIIMLLIIILNFRGWLRIVYSIGYIICSNLLMIVQFHAPGLFPDIQTRDMMLDMIANSIFVTVAITFITIRMINEYRYEKEINDKLTMQLDNLAKNDSLTGIYNRRYLEDRIGEIEDTGDDICLFIFDIDNFKEINDRLGHLEGDSILINLARIMIRIFHDMTSVRFGGDEFLIVGHGCSCSEMKTLINDFRKHIRNEINVTISGGVSKYEGDLAETLKKADQYLYEAKKSGKNRVIFGDRGVE